MSMAEPARIGAAVAGGNLLLAVLGMPAQQAAIRTAAPEAARPPWQERTGPYEQFIGGFMDRAEAGDLFQPTRPENTLNVYLYLRDPEMQSVLARSIVRGY
jgi:hypothetical protein